MLFTRTDAGGHSIVFTSDTGPSFTFDAMIERSGPIDLALVESTFLERSEHPGALHLSADEAGELAARGNITTMVLTHQAPLEDRMAHLERAGQKFSGEIVLAEVGVDGHLLAGHGVEHEAR